MIEERRNEVTMAVISQQINTLTEEVRALRLLTTKVAVLDTKAEAVQDDVDTLEKRINNWSAINSIGVLLAGIIGLFFGPKQ